MHNPVPPLRRDALLVKSQGGATTAVSLVPVDTTRIKRSQFYFLRQRKGRLGTLWLPCVACGKLVAESEVSPDGAVAAATMSRARRRCFAVLSFCEAGRGEVGLLGGVTLGVQCERK